MLRDSQLQTLRWADIDTGDIVCVQEGETIPADLFLLASSDAYGTAYIRTATLDGERNLKSRQALVQIKQEMQKSNIPIDQLKLRIWCEKPNAQIYQFHGDIKLDTPEMEECKLTLQQFVPRGSELSNTDWILGVAVYCGKDTKLMKSMGKNKYKMSHIERVLNKVVIFMIVLQTIFSIIFGIVQVTYQKDFEVKANGTNLKGHTYLYKGRHGDNESDFVSFIIAFLRFFLLFSFILNIALLISFEIIKTLQSIWMKWDAKMYKLEIDQPLKVLSISLNEELGMINTIFTDKTGTLTSNELSFKA